MTGDTSRSLQAWRDGGLMWRFRERSIFCRVAGAEDNPVLLLIHGFPTSSWDWAALWARFTQSYRVIAVDMLGFGFSDKPPAYDYRISEQADLLDALLRHCGCAPASSWRTTTGTRSLRNFSRGRVTPANDRVSKGWCC